MKTSILTLYLLCFSTNGFDIGSELFHHAVDCAYKNDKICFHKAMTEVIKLKNPSDLILTISKDISLRGEVEFSYIALDYLRENNFESFFEFSINFCFSSAEHNNMVYQYAWSKLAVDEKSSLRLKKISELCIINLLNNGNFDKISIVDKHFSTQPWSNDYAKAKRQIIKHRLQSLRKMRNQLQKKNELELSRQ